MEFNLAEATAILSHTPVVLNSLLRGLSSDWTTNNEGKTHRRRSEDRFSEIWLKPLNFALLPPTN